MRDDTSGMKGYGMVLRMVRSALRNRAIRTGKGVSLWRTFGKPTADEWTAYLRIHGGFQNFGDDCFISPETVFIDPLYTSIGRNVRIAGAWVSGHDGSINMINKAFGTKLDAVGPVII
ncbi:MAG: hypothetical protein SWI22_15685, partial [Pseudomonadota bacterium]|nr:hypothetical protein [Pseudomonadota bacterium]